MDEKIIKSVTWKERLLYPFYVIKNYFSDKKFVDEITKKLINEREINNKPSIPGINNFDAKITGACEVMIPGVGFECQIGLTDPQCTKIILEAQKTNRGIWGKFRPGGQCSRKNKAK